MQFFGTRRTPPGVRGLKLMSYRLDLSDGTVSHPTRGAWIEILMPAFRSVTSIRRTPPGVRGLKFEIAGIGKEGALVAPHPGCVD